MSSNSVFTSSFKQNESIKLIYQEMGFIIKTGDVMHISSSDTGKENINLVEPIEYSDEEMEIVLSPKRAEYNELIVRPNTIYGFFIKSYPVDGKIDTGNAPEWMTTDLNKKKFYSKKDVDDFCKKNCLPLVRICDNNFYLVTNIFKKTEENIVWSELKSRLLENSK